MDNSATLSLRIFQRSIQNELFCLSLNLRFFVQFLVFHDKHEIITETFNLISDCECTWNSTTNEFLTNCSNVGFTNLPKSFPNLTTHLLLKDNNLNYIRDKAFSSLVNLSWLDISNNKLYKIESQAFHNLSNLKILILKNNYLSDKNGSYPDDVFCPLANKLETLDIRRNLERLPFDFHTYPDKALSCLKSLETLRLDCISGQKLPHGFSKLSHLKTLDFSEGLQVANISDEFFDSVSNLKIDSLNFTNVDIQSINGSIFGTFKTLRILDLTNNYLLNRKTIDISEALKETEIEELYLTRTCVGAYRSEQDVIDNLNGTNVRILALDWNSIRNVRSIFNRISNLKVLTLTHNGIDDYFSLLLDFYLAKHLRKVDLSYQNTYLLQSVMDTPCYPPHEEEISNFTNVPYVYKIPIKNYCVFGTVCDVVWPDTLEWLAFSDVGFRQDKTPEMAFLNNGTMKYLNVSNNIFETFPKPINCRKNPDVFSTIEFVDASNCGIKCLNKTIFNFCQWSIKYANLSHNQLGLFEGGSNKNPGPRDISDSMKPLISLISFDLSYNSMSKLHSDTFENQVNLRELRLSNNELLNWEPNMTNLIHLEFLDLSYNQLTTLSEATILELNELETHSEYRTKEHISLNLEGNPLSCNCTNIDLLSWMSRSHIDFINVNRYRCISSNGQFVKVSSVDEMLANLETECIGWKWLIFNLLGLSLYFITVTIVTCCYRYRHYIRYVLLRMRMRRERLDALLGRYNEYKYDGFVSCTREGAKWVKRYLLPNLENEETGLKFCVAQRDFILGKTIIDNIMDTITKSRKTILLIDPTFIESKWCNEELLLSHHVSCCGMIL